MKDPSRTSKSLFEELQGRYPGQYQDIWLRTLHRRVHEWRAGMIVEFDDGWLEDEIITAGSLPRPLRGVMAEVTTEQLNLPSK